MSSPDFSSEEDGEFAGNRPLVTMANLMANKHLIVMVGLPARGKTYIAEKLARYLKWIGTNCKVIHVGRYRREATAEYRTHEFFNPSNSEAMELRKQVAEKALTDCLDFLQGVGDVAILDATNVTLERRRMIHQRVTEKDFSCFFIESVCDNPQLISTNIADVKVHGPDYAGMDVEEASEDFVKRMEHYEKMYVPMGEEKESDLSYVKIYNAGEKLVINRHEGNLQSRICYWLMNIHIIPRTIYLTRHGESEFNLVGKIGGDSKLSDNGNDYAKKLAEYFNHVSPVADLRVWTSFLTRTIQTGANINAPQEKWKSLNEIDAGVCEEMTYEEIKERYPNDYAAREHNKLTYRYPGGESYEDVINRLEPVIMELERQENLVVIAHQAVLRCILCYFMDTPLSKLPYVKVPLHTLIKISPIAHGCDVEYIPFGIDAVSTHRPREGGSTTSEEELSHNQNVGESDQQKSDLDANPDSNGQDRVIPGIVESNIVEQKSNEPSNTEDKPIANREKSNGAEEMSDVDKEEPCAIKQKSDMAGQSGTVEKPIVDNQKSNKE